MKVSWYSVFSFLLFLFRANGKSKKETWMRTTSITVMVIIPKVLFWKLPDFNYVQSSLRATLTTFTSHIDKGIWKASCSWRFYGNGSTCLPILSWVNIINRKWAKVPGRLWVVRKSNRVLWRIFDLLLYSFFSQTNLVFKFRLKLIE